MKQAIDELLERYYEGETTLAEEKRLREFFQQETIPPHLQSHAEQFRYFAATREQQPSAAFTQQLATKLTRPEPTRLLGLTPWTLRLAASVALLLLGFVGGIFYNQHQNPVADAPLPSAVSPAAEMKKVLAFSSLSETSASERIQAVNQSFEMTQADQATTQLLINTLNFDANVNVRQAACQALTHFEHEPGVREALIQSLSIQTDPNVQITLIEMLVAIKEKRAVQEMQRLAKRPQVMDVVRQKAQEGINSLAQLS
ncbi:HEAT repeat domain-containing protein [Fibrella sp. HMF5335]|uniref:HEAT repeat domain-containing protein n=1 Tax=Fibrella rubiginis TaxID=2817060 RepID=A0A939K8C7_9BACT|nr:HEAT repeat domain-containing protein [Fibrella rubiginis]MBO0939595.1 HEAT repeat domain-containing protein [Fibrella rubiginis]